MKLILPILAFVICHAVIVTAEDAPTKRGDGVAATDEALWGGLNLDERILNLKSRHSTRWFYFRKGGSVSATLGIKGGAITGTILSYRVVREWLHLIDTDGKVIYQLRLIKSDGSEVVVTALAGQSAMNLNAMSQIPRNDRNATQPSRQPPPSLSLGSLGAFARLL